MARLIGQMTPPKKDADAKIVRVYFVESTNEIFIQNLVGDSRGHRDSNRRYIDVVYQL